MGIIKYRKASAEDIELLLKMRLEMLRVVNHLPDEYEYEAVLQMKSREYFEKGKQTTVLAFDGEEAVGCASISYYWIMPTFSHPSGKRAHIMNVYTKESHRRTGIAGKMLEILMDEAREEGASEISLDATEMGRPLYEKAGFKDSDSCMVMKLNR